MASSKLKNSSAPLFISFDADPNFCDPKTATLPKEHMLVHLSPENFGVGIENGEIVCALVPIDYKYCDEKGKPIFGKVDAASLVEMLKLQAGLAARESESSTC